MDIQKQEIKEAVELPLVQVRLRGGGGAVPLLPLPIAAGGALLPPGEPCLADCLLCG